MEYLAKWAEIVIAFLLSTFLIWFCLEYLKNLKKANEELETMKDEQRRQRTTLEQVKFENRQTFTEIHTLRENVEKFSQRVQGEMENRDLRLREIEREAREDHRLRERLHSRIDIQDEKLRNYTRLVLKIAKEGD